MPKKIECKLRGGWKIYTWIPLVLHVLMLKKTVRMEQTFHPYTPHVIVISHMGGLAWRGFSIKLHWLVLVNGKRSNIYASIRTLPIKGNPMSKQTTLGLYLSYATKSFFDKSKSPCVKYGGKLVSAPPACRSHWLVAKKFSAHHNGGKEKKRTEKLLCPSSTPKSKPRRWMDRRSYSCK